MSDEIVELTAEQKNMERAARDIEEVLFERNLAGVVLITNGEHALRVDKLATRWNTIRYGDDGKMKMQLGTPGEHRDGSLKTMAVICEMAEGVVADHTAVLEQIMQKLQPESPQLTVLEGGTKPKEARVRMCRKCGCTEHNPCFKGGAPCRWVSENLCSACQE